MPDVLDMYGMLDDPWLGYRYRRQISPSPEPEPPPPPQPSWRDDILTGLQQSLTAGAPSPRTIQDPYAPIEPGFATGLTKGFRAGWSGDQITPEQVQAMPRSEAAGAAFGAVPGTIGGSFIRPGVDALRRTMEEGPVSSEALAEDPERARQLFFAATPGITKPVTRLPGGWMSHAPDPAYTMRRSYSLPAEEGSKGAYAIRSPDGDVAGGAHITLRPDGRTAVVDNIWAGDADLPRNIALDPTAATVANTLGPRAMRQVAQDFFRENPLVQEITGERFSGARAAPGMASITREQALGAPVTHQGGLLNYLQDFLADEAGELRLRGGMTPRQRLQREITLDRPLPEVEPLPERPTASGHNALYYGQEMPVEAPPAIVPAARARQVAPAIPKNRDPTFGEQLRAQHLEHEDALPLAGGRMIVEPPPHIKTQADLEALVDRYIADVRAGEKAGGKYWYEKSGQGILEHTGGVPEVATPMAGALARTSPQTDVASNMTHAVTMHNQYMAGEPLQAGRFPNAMGRDVEKIYRGGEQVTGEKIGPFMGAVARQWAPGMFPHELVTDIWQMRGLEYPGKMPGELYNGSPTLGQHNFSRIVTDMARRKLAATGEDWTPWRVQASGWGGIKKRIEGLPEQEAGGGAFNFDDALRRNYAQLSIESAPHGSTDHFPELLDPNTPWELKQQYHDDVQKIMRDPVTGRDHIAQHLGMLTGRTVDAPGYFEGMANPGSQVPVAVGQAPGGALKGGVDSASRELMDTYGRVYALLHRQGAHAWHKPVWTGNVPISKQDLFDVTVGRPLTPDETIQIAKALHQELGNNWHSPVATKDGFRFLNEPDYSKVSNKRFVAAVHKVLQRDDILPGVEGIRTRQTAKAGNYEDNDWRVDTDGEVYRRGLGATRSPDLQRRAAEILATLGPRLADLNGRYVRDYGWKEGPQRRWWEEPAYQSFKLDQFPRVPRPGEVRRTEDIGPGWKPLFGPGSILGSLMALIGGGAALSPGGAEAQPYNRPPPGGLLYGETGR